MIDTMSTKPDTIAGFDLAKLRTQRDESIRRAISEATESKKADMIAEIARLNGITERQVYRILGAQEKAS